VQILLNGWVRICKSQRREQEMVFMIYPCWKAFRFTYLFSSKTPTNGGLWAMLFSAVLSLDIYKLYRWNMMSLRKSSMAWNLVFCLGTFVSLFTLFCVFRSFSDTSHLFFYLKCLRPGWLLTIELTVAWCKIIKHYMVWSLVLLFLCVLVVSFLG